jgi:hypothetical protein
MPQLRFPPSAQSALFAFLMHQPNGLFDRKSVRLDRGCSAVKSAAPRDKDCRALRHGGDGDIVFRHGCRMRLDGIVASGAIDISVGALVRSS